MTVDAIPALPKKEQIRLYKTRELGLSPEATRRQVIAGRRAEEELVRSCVGLVNREAARWSGHNISSEDLVAEGLLGVVRALVTFDPERDTAFSSHAHYWVYAFISKYVETNSEKLKYKAAGIYNVVGWDGHALTGANRAPRDEIDERGRYAYDEDEVTRLVDPALAVEDQMLDALGLGSIDVSPVLALLSPEVARYFRAWQSVPVGLGVVALSKRLELRLSQVRKLGALTMAQIGHPCFRAKLDQFI
jgi:hypothetical protein